MSVIRGKIRYGKPHGPTKIVSGREPSKTRDLEALHAAHMEELKAARKMRSRYTDAWRSQDLRDIAAFEAEIVKYDAARAKSEELEGKS